jgi:hypothetical protein
MGWLIKAKRSTGSFVSTLCPGKEAAEVDRALRKRAAERWMDRNTYVRYAGACRDRTRQTSRQTSFEADWSRAPSSAPR